MHMQSVGYKAVKLESLRTDTLTGSILLPRLYIETVKLHVG